MTDDASWAPPGVDTRRASPARVYDYWLGGSHNFQADRDAARALIAVEPSARDVARANRAFLARAVRFLAAEGIRQFLDIGSGIPTQGNVHEVARAAAPGARVLYADIDPVAVAHSRAILDGDGSAAAIAGDLREPEQILASPEAARLLDTSQPMGLLLAAVLHFLTDADDPWRLVGRLRDLAAPGSYLVISHATTEDTPAGRAAMVESAYNRTVAIVNTFRARARIGQFFDGFSLVQPGIVYLPDWRPDAAERAVGDRARRWFLAGAGRKP